MKPSSVIDWLLEPDQPAVRYLTLVNLLDLSERDSEVSSVRSDIGSKGWVREIFQLQNARGYWGSSESLYDPKYTATNWRMLVLSDLGISRDESRISKASSLFFEGWLDERKEENIFTDEICVVGNTARMLTRFGYEDDGRVKRLFDRIVEIQKEDGGWHCFESDTGTLDSWEGLAAFASLPKSKWTRKIRNSAERGAEFYLQRHLFREGRRRYAPWFRFHYPRHYYYDLLVGLDVITSLGYTGDTRLKPALEILKRRRLKDGRWILDAAHPDLGQGAEYRLRRKPKRFILEKVGQPSKMITLIAMKVLKRVEGDLPR